MWGIPEWVLSKEAKRHSCGPKKLGAYVAKSVWGNPLGNVDLRAEKPLRGISRVLLLEFLLISPEISALHQMFKIIYKGAFSMLHCVS